MKIEVITLPPDEWAAYRALRLEALRDEPQAFHSTFMETYTKPESFWRGRLEAARDGGNNWLLFARNGKGDLLGMVGAIVEKPGTATVISMYVTGKARGQGTGKALLTALLDELGRASDITRISLQVNSIQSAAVRLYEDCGFKVVEKLRYYSGDGKEYGDYIMEEKQ